MSETAYAQPCAPGESTPHHYGPQFHLHADAWALSALARLGSPHTRTRDVHRLLRACYQRLAHAACRELRTARASVPTRMQAVLPDAAFEGALLDPQQRVVIADIARAGIVPSDVLQQFFLDVLADESVRVDHLYMERRTDDAGQVVGVDLSGSKLGGDVDDAVVFIPDPMGATGGSIRYVVDHYREQVGEPRRFVALHLMVTPEYLRRMAQELPELAIYALRVDRGLSPADVLSTPLGSDERERGLTDTQYIAPGAGGLGELLNNAFV